MKSTIACKIFENHLGGHVFQEGMQIVTENPAAGQMQEQPHLRWGGGQHVEPNTFRNLGISKTKDDRSCI